ncbi:helix-hairpin-helix domain-containing protein [Vreelandella alkaliphila]|uniref:Helix-hairpin-helix domain-containing protein n=1 Tax=Vreelandella alkaliphila TaxID=272774 RepID=A0AAJ2RXM4_9GAMM|nr:helix-hairpin-helix domain-containing protein [Halomonas alkaliphila]MDX5976882.1 helix-hairpin-helix domain-containing protein [Halomonas alkaliphila]
MAFSDAERDALLSVKGVGPTALKRFEEIGIDSFTELAARQVDEIAEMVAAMLHTTCWKNSPQAKAAISAAITKAQEGV